MKKSTGDNYLSSYCNQYHEKATGKPIDHECRVIPPAALEAERVGDTDLAIRILERCGKCSNCKKLARVQRAVLRCCNSPFSHADQDVIDLWNAELERLPCTGRR